MEATKTKKCNEENDRKCSKKCATRNTKLKNNKPTPIFCETKTLYTSTDRNKATIIEYTINANITSFGPRNKNTIFSGIITGLAKC